MSRCFAACIAASLVGAAGAPLLAAAGDDDSFVIRAGRIMPVSESHSWVIENGVIVVRDGRIEAIGADIVVPPDLRIIDLPDAVVMPGLVAASTGMGGNHAGEESVSAAYRAADAFDAYGDYRGILASGVTTVHLSPGWHRLVAGRGAVVRLGGLHDERMLADAADLTINLGDGALNPPAMQHLLIPPSGDQTITPSQPQRPASRMGQYLALKEAIERSGGDVRGDIHVAALREAWAAGLPLRIQAQREEDLRGAVAFLASQNRRGYIVGGIEAAKVATVLRDAGVPLVYTLDTPLRSLSSNLGSDPDVLAAQLADLGELDGLTLALGLVPGVSAADLRLVGATALRAGLTEQQVLAGLTRVPAQVLGLGDRIGSLAPGYDADLVIMSGHPLETTSHVKRVYARGRLVHLEDAAGALVVHAGTIWLGPDQYLEDGSILIEAGRITSVGRRVPHPPGARVLDAGEDAFITPGFIDAFGHLGMEGDTGSLPPQLSVAGLVGAADLASRRVSGAGVTTVITSAYQFDGAGSQVSAVKTDGAGRDERLVSSSAAIVLSVRGNDVPTIAGRLNGRIAAGKKYLETWQKYEKDLADWEANRSKGAATAAAPAIEEVAATTQQTDPVTGTWQARVFGGPLPREFEGKIAFRLTGNAIEGRITEPPVPMEHRIVGTLDGTKIRGTIEIDTGGMGTPSWQADLIEPDVMRGTITLQGFDVNFEARRVDKGAVEFKVERVRRRTTGKDGRPLPPPIDESLEPLRAALEKRIPVVVDAATTAEIDAALDVLVDEHGLLVVLLNAENADRHAARLKEKSVGVVVSAEVAARPAPPQGGGGGRFPRGGGGGGFRDEAPAPGPSGDVTWYERADSLARAGVAVAFQSDAEDAARLLPLRGLLAVERGMSAEAALAALTIDVARMFRLDSRIGSIAAGRDGDLVIFSGHPFDASSAILHVIVNGKEVHP